MNLPEVAFFFFLAQGWTEHQAAGIVGNLQVECGLEFTCSNASGGIAQWRAERVTRFQRVFGYPFGKSSFVDQLSYIQWELCDPKSPWNKSGKVLLTAKDETSAASLFDIHYERSAGTARKRRMDFAQKVLEKYGDRAVSEVLAAFSALPARKTGPDQLALCSQD